jgi:hypothetical protein
MANLRPNLTAFLAGQTEHKSTDSSRPIDCDVYSVLMFSGGVFVVRVIDTTEQAKSPIYQNSYDSLSAARRFFDSLPGEIIR